MNLEDLPPEILSLISDYTGIYNFNLAQVSLLFSQITKRNHVTPEEYRDGLFREGDLVTIKRFNLPFTEKNIEEAVYFGHLHVLIWAYEKGLKLSIELTRTAARGGHLEVLQWLSKFNLDEWTCVYAARGGHLEVLQWLSKFNLVDERICTFAAEGGHLEVLKWARENKLCPWDKRTCALAALAGHLEFLKSKREAPSIKSGLSETARGGHLEVLKWLRDSTQPTLEYTKEEHLDLLNWALANGCPVDRDIRLIIENTS